MSDIFATLKAARTKYVAFEHVPASIDGHFHSLDEYDVRALQLVCRNFCACSRNPEEACKEFNGRVKVRRSPWSEDYIIFQPDGCLSQPFERGFLDAADNMALELLV